MENPFQAVRENDRTQKIPEKMVRKEKSSKRGRI